MRKALNENPKVQAGVIVALLIAGVLLFMKMSSKGGAGGESNIPAASADATGVMGSGAGAVSADGSPVGTAGATDAATAVATDPATAAPAAGTAAATAAPAVPTAPSAATAVSPEALVPGPGMPADVAQAFARGDAVVLLIVKPGATDDDLVRSSVRRISGPGVSVFVAPASRVARYSRITQGVGVNRVPALIAIRSRRVGGDTPQATVSYGFRDTQSVVQTARDALYGGSENVPYHPG